MGDEEPHALVGNLDCSGAVHVGETALKKTITIQNSYKTKAIFGSEVSKDCKGDLCIQGRAE